MRRMSATALTLATLLVAAPLAGRAGAEDPPVAVVGGHPVTQAALDEHVKAKLIEIDNERYEALKEGLDELVAKELLEQEAKATGTTAEALEKKEITDKAAAPTDAVILMPSATSM